MNINQDKYEAVNQLVQFLKNRLNAGEIFTVTDDDFYTASWFVANDYNNREAIATTLIENEQMIKTLAWSLHQAENTNFIN